MRCPEPAEGMLAFLIDQMQEHVCVLFREARKKFSSLRQGIILDKPCAPRAISRGDGRNLAFLNRRLTQITLIALIVCEIP